MTHTFKIITTTAVVLLSFSNAVFASKELAQSKNCLACHGIDKKGIGPSIKSISEKYSTADAVKIAALASKVRSGGVGTFGSIPMPANPQVNATESETLVKWFLTGGK
jgi:cytochrome c